MTSGYPGTRPRGTMGRSLAFIEDFMNWLLYGYETWLVAVLKGVPLFLYVYFLVAYVPNYVFYLTTVEIPFLRFSAGVGFVLVNAVGGANFAAIIIMALWTQAARGRRGFGWQLIRVLDFFQLLFVLLLIIPALAFNVAGGSVWPPAFPLQAIALGTITAGLGAAALVYLYFEYRRITRLDAEDAAARSAAYSAG